MTLGTQRVAHVELRGVGKRFGGTEALVGIDADIERGSIHGLVGENGAGKSTLGKIVAGVIRPDAGQVIVNGAPVAYGHPANALKDGTTTVTQEMTLVPHMSVIDNVFLGAFGRGINNRASKKRYAELSSLTGFAINPTKRVSSLRISDQRGVEIMRAVACNPHLIVMDEPTASLTADEGAALFEVIRRLQERGTTILYVSHFLAEVLSLADTVTVLRDGRLVKTSATADETPETLVTSMLGRRMELTFPQKHFPLANAPVALSAHGVSRGRIVRDVHLDLHAGEIVGLAGLVGSGRTEVARLIFGADKMSAGHVEVDGKALRIRGPRTAIRAGIGMLPESRRDQGLVMNRAITENMTIVHLDLIAAAGFVQGRREKREVATLMERLDVRAKAPTAQVNQLSGGNQQKVLFGKWLFKQPRVLIADEPTRGVDVSAKRAIYELIQTLALRGMGVLVISSEVEEILGLCHRVLVMRGGKIVAELDGRTATEDAVMHAAFGSDRTSRPQKGTV